MAVLHVYTNFACLVSSVEKISQVNCTETNDVTAHLRCTKANLHCILEGFSFPNLPNILCNVRFGFHISSLPSVHNTANNHCLVILCRWTYFGSETGMYRSFPAAEWPSTFAGFKGDYDPRSQPWYLSATSGPKAVGIFLDCSDSMRRNQRCDV